MNRACFVIAMGLLAGGLSAGLGWTSSPSTGPLAGTHAGMTLNGGTDIYRKEPGFMPVAVLESEGPDFGRLSEHFSTGWGAGSPLEVAALSLGTDAINEEAAGKIEDRHGVLRDCVVANVDEDGWVALQFTVEADTSGLTGDHVAALQAEGADAPYALFCYVFPGSSLDVDGSGAPSTLEPRITRSLSRTELGIDQPITALNTHLALYLLEDPALFSSGVSHSLEHEPTVYFSVSNAVGTFTREAVYRTTWDASGSGSWSTPEAFATFEELELPVSYAADGATVPIVVDGLAIDATEEAPKMLLSTNWPGASSEFLFYKKEFAPPSTLVWGPPYIYAANEPTGPKPLDVDLGGAPVGDMCYLDPFMLQSTKPLLDHYVFGYRRAADVAGRPISASAFRSIERGKPAATFLATWNSKRTPKRIRLDTWLEQRKTKTSPWLRTTDKRVHRVPALTGSQAGMAVRLPGRPFGAPSQSRRFVGQWSFRVRGERFVSKVVALHY